MAQRSTVQPREWDQKSPRPGVPGVVHKHAYNADKTEWTSEVAIPLASMKVDAVQDGETWGLLLARDYDVTQPNASVVSSDWRFGVGRLMDLAVFHNGYGLEKDYARSSLGGSPTQQPLSEARWEEYRKSFVSVPDFSFEGYTAKGSLPAATDVLKQYGLTAMAGGGGGGGQACATTRSRVTSAHGWI